MRVITGSFSSCRVNYLFYAPGTRFRDAGRGRVVMGTGLRFPSVLQPSYPLVAFHYLMRSRTDIIGAAALVIGALVMAGCTQQAPGMGGILTSKTCRILETWS